MGVNSDSVMGVGVGAVPGEVNVAVTDELVSADVILVSAGYDHTIRFWDINTGLCTRTLQHADSQVNAMALTPERRLVAAAGYQHIRMYDINSRENAPVISYEQASKNVTSVGFQAEGRWMFTGGEDCTARIWDMRAETVQCSRIFQVSHPVNSVCLHPNQCELVVGDQGGTVHLWDLRNDHNEPLILEPGISIQHIDVDSQGSQLAAVSNRGVCYVMHLVSGTVLPPGGATTSGGSNGGIGTPPGATGGEGATNGSAPLSNPNGSPLPPRVTPRDKLTAHTRYALKCRFSPDSTLLATTSADQTAAVWRTSDLSKVSVLASEKQRWVWDCAFSMDSDFLITGSSDNALRLWRISDGKVEREFNGHQKPVTAIAFSDVAYE